MRLGRCQGGGLSGRALGKSGSGKVRRVELDFGSGIREMAASRRCVIERMVLRYHKPRPGQPLARRIRGWWRIIESQISTLEASLVVDM